MWALWVCEFLGAGGRFRKLGAQNLPFYSYFHSSQRPLNPALVPVAHRRPIPHSSPGTNPTCNTHIINNGFHPCHQHLATIPLLTSILPRIFHRPSLTKAVISSPFQCSDALRHLPVLLKGTFRTFFFSRSGARPLSPSRSPWPSEFHLWFFLLQQASLPFALCMSNWPLLAYHFLSAIVIFSAPACFTFPKATHPPSPSLLTQPFGRQVLFASTMSNPPLPAEMSSAPDLPPPHSSFATGYNSHMHTLVLQFPQNYLFFLHENLRTYYYFLPSFLTEVPQVIEKIVNGLFCYWKKVYQTAETARHWMFGREGYSCSGAWGRVYKLVLYSQDRQWLFLDWSLLSALK